MRHTILIEETESALLLKKFNPDFTVIPTSATELSAGYDVFSCHPVPVVIYPGDSFKIPLGFKLSMGFLAAWLVPTSGTRDYRLKNTIGLIDPDYRGEVMALIRNPTEKPLIISPMEKIGQMVFFQPLYVDFHKVASVDDNSERGSAGFGQATKQNSKVSLLADKALSKNQAAFNSFNPYSLKQEFMLQRPNIKMLIDNQAINSYTYCVPNDPDKVEIRIYRQQGIICVIQKGELIYSKYVGTALEENLRKLFKEFFLKD